MQKLLNCILSIGQK